MKGCSYSYETCFGDVQTTHILDESEGRRADSRKWVIAACWKHRGFMTNAHPIREWAKFYQRELKAYDAQEEPRNG